MIIVKLQGGLGNQMFQYACGKAMAEKRKTSLHLDSSTLEKVVSNINFTNRSFELFIFDLSTIERPNSISAYDFIVNYLFKFIFNKFNFYQIYSEFDRNYDTKIERLKGNIHLQGYWQTEKYFQNYAPLIRKSLVFKALKNEITEQCAKDIKACTAVSIHVRRGDYVSSITSNDFHGITAIDYYFSAMQHILQQVKNPVFFVFSDDCTWVQNNLVRDRANMKIVSHNINEDSWQDMYLMSICKHNIIANSSFSWWGAWLNNTSNKIVIAPKKWFANDHQNTQTQDILPSTWIKL